MRLRAHEFLRRFLLHVLPDGFHRIRHYAFLAKPGRSENLAHVRKLLRVVSEPPKSADPAAQAQDPQPRQSAPIKLRSPTGTTAAASCAASRSLRLGHAGAFRCDTT